MKAVKVIWQSDYLKAGLIVFAIILIGLDYYQISIFPVGPVDTDVVGNLGEWVSGFIATVALLISAETLKSSNRQLSLIEIEKKRERRITISSVYCWLEFELDHYTRKKTGLRVIFVNKTEVPVYTWRILIEGYTIPTINQNNYGPIMLERTIINLDIDIYEFALSQPGIPKVELFFTNSAGEEMQRDSLGNLLNNE